MKSPQVRETSTCSAFEACKPEASSGRTSASSVEPLSSSSEVRGPVGWSGVDLVDRCQIHFGVPKGLNDGSQVRSAWYHNKQGPSRRERNDWVETDVLRSWQ